MIATQQLHDFIGFISKPNQKKAELHWKSVLQHMIFGLILSILVYVFIFVLFLIVNSFYDESVLYKGKDFIKKEYGVYGKLFIVNLLAPLIEELAYRLPLKKKRLYLFTSLTLFSYFFVCNFYGYSYYSIDFELIFRIILALGIGGLLTFLFRNLYFKIPTNALVYASVLIFSLVHVLNYKFDFIMIPLIIIRILPQLYSGFLLAFFRMRLGIVFAYLFHCINNMIF